ncbi:MAG: adenylosuccinate synthetase [Patescibacteria group bacterium]
MVSDERLKMLFRQLGDDVFVIGLTWSDEGKGKVAHELAAGAHATVRWHGGASAGHNIMLRDGTKVHLHNLPCGIVRANVPRNYVGPMSVVDPECLRRENSLAEQYGRDRTFVDQGALVVLPLHKFIDGGRETRFGAKAYGTTKTGMGPAHEDLFGRKGLRVRDFVSAKQLRAKLTERRYYEEKQAIAGFWGIRLPSLNETVRYCRQFVPLFQKLQLDTRAAVQTLRRQGRPILWEGAHGVMIDVIQGTMSTSSLVGPWSAMHSYGPMRSRLAVIGTFRPYVTRTGAGPMPTEMTDDEATRLQVEAGEVESTTGRKQRCGWLDLEAIRHTARLSGTTHLIITKLDVMPFKTVRIANGYQPDAGYESGMTLTEQVLENVRPQYVDLPGWDGDDVAAATTWNDLPSATKKFVELVETATRLPVIAIGNGPQCGDLVLRKS